MVVVHAPVFLPSSSIVFAAMGIDEWTIAARVAEHQDLSRLRGLGRRGRGKRGHHLRHVVGAGRLSDGRQIAAAAARRSRWGGRCPTAPSTAAGRRRREPQRGIQGGAELIGRDRPALGRVGRVVPLLERALHLGACHRAVLVGVKRRPQCRVAVVAAAAAACPRRGPEAPGPGPEPPPAGPPSRRCRRAMENVSLPRCLPATRAGVAIAIERDQQKGTPSTLPSPTSEWLPAFVAVRLLHVAHPAVVRIVRIPAHR